jgi:hypothetical protein
MGNKTTSIYWRKEQTNGPALCSHFALAHFQVISNYQNLSSSHQQIWSMPKEAKSTALNADIKCTPKLSLQKNAQYLLWRFSGQ